MTLEIDRQIPIEYMGPKPQEEALNAQVQPRTKKKTPLLYNSILSLSFAIIYGGLCYSIVAGVKYVSDVKDYPQEIQRRIDRANSKFPVPPQSDISEAIRYSQNPTPYDSQKKANANHIVEQDYFNHQERVRQGATKKFHASDASILAFWSGILSAGCGLMLMAESRVALEESGRRKRLQEVYDLAHSPAGNL